LKVGAVIVKDQNIISFGYNGMPAGMDNNCEDELLNEDGPQLITKPEVIHAEANALLNVKRGEGDLLACTLLPCGSCATLIAAHGIKHVIYNEVYKRDTSSLEIFKFYGIECEQLV
jgi:dCMP deaminase